MEFWVVATRPLAVNGLGWTPQETKLALQMLLNQFKWLEETPDIFRLWFSLATSYNISGKRTHDLRIIAIDLSAMAYSASPCAPTWENIVKFEKVDQ